LDSETPITSVIFSRNIQAFPPGVQDLGSKSELKKQALFVTGCLNLLLVRKLEQGGRVCLIALSSRSDLMMLCNTMRSYSKRPLTIAWKFD
jgi:hypothetical protein